MRCWESIQVTLENAKEMRTRLGKKTPEKRNLYDDDDQLAEDTLSMSMLMPSFSTQDLIETQNEGLNNAGIWYRPSHIFEGRENKQDFKTKMEAQMKKEIEEWEEIKLRSVQRKEVKKKLKLDGGAEDKLPMSVNLTPEKFDKYAEKLKDGLKNRKKKESMMNTFKTTIARLKGHLEKAKERLKKVSNLDNLGIQ